MRDLTANALTQISEKLGGEPIYIIDIQWVKDGTIYRYADRSIPNEVIEGRILEVSALDAVVTATSESQAVSIVLDDKDGVVKAIMDTNDIHKRDAWIYQWFEGLDITDNFLLFRGQVNSPLKWNEADRTVSFTIMSQIEDKELGFSAEEGQFDFISNELIGEAWPLCFGTCVYNKTLKLSEPTVGTTADGVAMADPAIKARMDALQVQIEMFQNQQQVYLYSAALARLDENEAAAEYNQSIADASAESWQQRQREYLELEYKYNLQLATELSSFRMFNADRFPSGTVSIRVGELFLEGYKSGANFIITGRTHPKLIEDSAAELPYAEGGYTSYDTSSGWTYYRGPDDGHGAWYPYAWIKGDNDWGYIYESPGTNVYLRTNEPQKYIVSIVPGTILNVSTMLQHEGQKFLSNVSDDKWSQGTENFGPVSAVVLYLSDALSKDVGAGYSDDLYVTFESDVGPNTVNIMEYVIQNYTEFSVDSTSFDSVRTKVANYPSHFSIQSRINVLDFLHDVAWQARCQLRLVNNVFYLTYLPQSPTPVATISESDIDVGSFEIEHTPTENLTTKMICNWRATGAQEIDNRVILRHNVAKYGVHEQTHDFYIYNKIDFVIKSATFWMIRNANTWKIARFTTPLHLLNVETQDSVTLSIPHIATGNIIALVDEASYNSDDRSIQFQCWTGVKAGQMTQYDFVFPASIDETLTFPTPEEIAAGLDGGFGNNKAATGELGTEALESRVHHIEYSLVDSFGLDKRRYNDRGDPTPSDQGDVSPGVPIIESPPILSIASPAPYSGDITGYSNPTQDSELSLRPVDEAPMSRIDLHSTLIYDSVTNLSCPLDTFFEKVSTAYEKEGNYLHGKTTAIWSDSGYTDGREFVFQYDTVSGRWGAGLAFFS